MDEVNLVLVVEPNVSRSLQRRSFRPSPSGDGALRNFSNKNFGAAYVLMDEVNLVLVIEPNVIRWT